MTKHSSPSKALLLCAVWVISGYAKPSPSNGQQGPCVGMDCMHGVLMHNDESQGGDHKAEDQYLRFKEALKTGEEPAGPLNAGEEYHGVLMHGDDETGHQHGEKQDILPEVKKEILPKDLNEDLHGIMHGEEGVHKHSWDNDNSEKGNKGPSNHDQVMHGLLMHGDENHEDDAIDTETQVLGDAGPKDAGEFLHGVLMHGDKEPGKEHSHDDSSTQKEDSMVKGPLSDQLHGILMHGDSEMGHDHSEEDASSKHEVFSDIRKIVEMDLDEALLKVINLEKILENDMKEYKDWKANNPEHEDERIMGSTYVDSSILNDIAKMKQRYLNKENDVDDTVAQAEDEIPFTHEDANSVLDEHAQKGEGEDMRHDLELLGSTDPLNARHSAQLERRKSKKDL